MKITLEKVEQHTAYISIEIEAEQAKSEYLKVLRGLGRKAKIPGFRPGKAPDAIVENYYGKGTIQEETLQRLYQAGYTQALEETKLRPIEHPHIHIDGEFKLGEPLKLHCHVEVLPEVKLKEFKNLEVEAPQSSMTEEMVADQLKRIQESAAQLHSIEEPRPVKVGDHVTFDFDGFVEGEPLEHGSAQDFVLEIGSGRFIPGFEDQIVGMKPGESGDITVNFPEDYHEKSIAGKPATFKVTIKSIQEKRLPELNDEFAKEVSAFETLEELKADIRSHIEKSLEEQNKNTAKVAIMDEVVSRIAFDIPEKMIEKEATRMFRDMVYRLASQGMDPQAALGSTNMEEIQQRYREPALKRIKEDLAVNAIAKQEKIDVAPSEVDAEMDNLAKAYNLSKSEVVSRLNKFEGVDSLYESLLSRKVMDFLYGQNKIKAKEPAGSVA